MRQATCKNCGGAIAFIERAPAPDVWVHLDYSPNCPQAEPEPESERASRLQNVLFPFMRVAEEILANHTEKKGIVTVTNVSEMIARLKTYLRMAKDALGTLDKGERWDDNVFDHPEKMSNEALCNHFASTYQIHSNPRMYHQLKAGHDEILRRLQNASSLKGDGQ